MKKQKIKILMIVLLVIIFLGIMINKVWAYLTSYVTATGGVKIEVGCISGVGIDENFNNGKKYINVQNTTLKDCYIRVKIIAPESITTELQFNDASGKWSKNEEDGYWYYSDILAPGVSTETLEVDLNNIMEEKRNIAQTDTSLNVDFNIAVVSESTIVYYEEDGNPYADWERRINIGG